MAGFSARLNDILSQSHYYNKITNKLTNFNLPDKFNKFRKLASNFEQDPDFVSIISDLDHPTNQEYILHLVLLLDLPDYILYELQDITPANILCITQDISNKFAVLLEDLPSLFIEDLSFSHWLPTIDTCAFILPSGILLHITAFEICEETCDIRPQVPELTQIVLIALNEPKIQTIKILLGAPPLPLCISRE
jgi:hypothetical protein